MRKLLDNSTPLQYGVRVILDVSAIPANPVGAGTYACELAREIHQKVDLTLACRKNDTDRWYEIAPSARLLPITPNHRATRIAFGQFGLGRRLGDRFDIFHSPHYTLPRALSVPGVVTVHDMTFFTHPEWHEKTKVRFFKAALKQATLRAKAIIAVSQYTADCFRKEFPVSAPVFVAPHGVDTNTFSANRQTADSELLASVGARQPYVMFAGTMEPRKNIPSVVRAFSEIAQEYSELQLVLAGGDGWGTREVQHAVANSKAATRILRPGYVPKTTLAALFRNAEFVVYPSWEEGFGLPALEALASGAPLITTSGSAIEEVVGSAAILVRPGSDADLRAAMFQILNEPDTAAKLHAIGPEQAAGFTWARSASVHLDAYQLASS